MKKSGFTLPEVLGVLTVLALLALLITPVVSKTIKNNKQKLYNVQIETIEKAAHDYAIKNTDILPEEGNTSYLTLGEIKRSGLLPEEVRNPITKELFPDDLQIEITIENNQYVYKVVEQEEAGIKQ
ncbi:MAG: prepilin-type N-terminal cleavage/methylation domain-containing protein [Bacilli bacterium]|nr:prepilin-type N-terminal cleavage/methylation domain-containing protein [Bacilli bacterium]